MKKRFALLTAVALMSSSMFVQAATFTSSDSAVQLVTPDDNWYVEDFEGAILFVTNGNDRVSVKVFEKGEEIPAPMTSEDAESYEGIYQTYYTTPDCTYVITGLAQTNADMDTVRKIVESIQLDGQVDETTEETSEESTEEENESNDKKDSQEDKDAPESESDEDFVAPEAKGDYDVDFVAPEARGDYDKDFVAPEARGDY